MALDPAVATLASRLVDAAVAAAQPAPAVRAALSWTPDGAALLVGAETRVPVDDAVTVLGAGKASAQMAAAVVAVLAARPGGRQPPRTAGGVVVTKYGHADGASSSALAAAGVAVAEAGHPQPDAAGAAAAAHLLAAAATSPAGAPVLVCLSGGGSALTPLPGSPSLSLAHLQAATAALLGCGAAIHEVNCVRKHLSGFAGGRLAAACPAGTAAVVTLALSDVIGDTPSVIASGPTVPDPTTFADALAVLARYGLLPPEAGAADEPASAALPPAVVVHLRAGAAGAVPETLKAVPTGHTYHVIGSNALAVAAEASAARDGGFVPVVLTSALRGEAADVGRTLAAALTDAQTAVTTRTPLDAAGLLRRLDAAGFLTSLPSDGDVAAAVAAAADASARGAPLCLVAGGETTVTLPAGCAGRGGRNQELALAAAIALAADSNDGGGGASPPPATGLPALLSFGTDGTDGPTDAAGAVASAATVAAAAAAGVDARAHLARHDSYNFYRALEQWLLHPPSVGARAHSTGSDAVPTTAGASTPSPLAPLAVRPGGLIVTGPTGTNVMDVVVLLTTPTT
jgi:glycerate 2-kinase